MRFACILLIVLTNHDWLRQCGVPPAPIATSAQF
jgi:hypothetical protein